MPLLQLTLESLKDIDDGRVMLAFQHELKRAVMDCIDRPGDKNARTVSLEFKLTPIVGDEGQCDGAHGEFNIKSKVPARKSKSYEFGLNRKGHLIYSSNSPDDLDQTTIDDINPETGRIER